MDNIQVGDLVVVVKPIRCCGNDSLVGKPFTVIGYPVHQRKQCIFCLSMSDTLNDFMLYGDISVDRNRLKRIPPLSELESIKTQEEIPA